MLSTSSQEMKTLPHATYFLNLVYRGQTVNYSCDLRR